MIELKNVTKQFGSFCAVDGISLELKKGEIFAFLGINGAGKTTTIRMMTGIIKPTSGDILIGGHSITEDPLRAKAITGYIPDRPYLYPKLTGRELLYFVTDLYKVEHKTADERIEKLLNEYGLLDWQNELVESYSHGMKQRLATCAALVHDPQALVIDEPMVGLDPHGAKFLKEQLKHYAHTGKTIFLSTHSLNVAEELADRLAIIHQGQIIASGTLDEIRKQSGTLQERLENIFICLTSA